MSLRWLTSNFSFFSGKRAEFFAPFTLSMEVSSLVWWVSQCVLWRICVTSSRLAVCGRVRVRQTARRHIVEGANLKSFYLQVLCTLRDYFTLLCLFWNLVSRVLTCDWCVTSLCCRLRMNRGSVTGTGIRFFLSLLQSVQICSGTHPALYLTGTEGFFPEVWC